jgi:hypothetical protein
MLADLGYVAFAPDLFGEVFERLARGAAAVRSVVSFHGGLTANAPARPGEVEATFTHRDVEAPGSAYDERADRR